MSSNANPNAPEWESFPFSAGLNEILHALESRGEAVSLADIIRAVEERHPKGYVDYPGVMELVKQYGTAVPTGAWAEQAMGVFNVGSHIYQLTSRVFMLGCLLYFVSETLDRIVEEQKASYANTLLGFIEKVRTESTTFKILSSLDVVLTEAGMRWYRALVDVQTAGKDSRANNNAKGTNGSPEGAELLEELKNCLHSDEFSVDDEDILGYDLHAHNLFNILTDKQTNPPLNIGILAPWGRGKTSLMRKVEQMFKEQRIKSTPKDSTEGKVLLLSDLRKWLKDDEAFPVPKIPFATVWFNPWNYQSSDMIWAGMANAIVEQVVEQLPDAIARETFWFRLRLSRINKEEIRKELQIRSVLFGLQFIVWGIALLVSMAAFVLQGTSSGLGVLGVTSILGVFSSVASYLKPNKKSISEVFEKYSKAPQYLNKLGTFHDVHEDMQIVFSLLISEEEPLVIFVDDLDRCSPSKVVEVVEAINVFISGDHRKKCYFILGMDAEIVAASLDVAYEKMKGKVINRETEQGSLGWYFLDKFIQLPFFIPVMNEGKKLEYLRYLLKQSTAVKNNGYVAADEKATLKDHELKELAQKVLQSQPGEASKQLMSNLNMADSKELDKAILEQQVKNNLDSDKISEQVGRYSSFLNSDPRTLKRFANLLRFYNSYQVLRRMKQQPHIPIHHLGKYLALMLKFPQLIRWLQWDTENRHGISTNATSKALLIDDAIRQLVAQDSTKDVYRYWYDEKELAGSKQPYNHIATIIQMQADLPWLKSQSLLNILLSERDDAAALSNALECNVW